MKVELKLQIVNDVLGLEKASLTFNTPNGELRPGGDYWQLTIPFKELPLPPTIIARGDVHVGDVWVGKVEAVDLRHGRKEPTCLVFEGLWASPKARKLVP